jgi:hypothetical protein
VISVEGSYSITSEILAKVDKFVNEVLQLKFNPDKTSILRFDEHPFKFIGFEIESAEPHSKRRKKQIESVVVGSKNVRRRKKVRIRINMDTQKVLKKLQANGFIRKRTSHLRHNELEYRGMFRGNLINLEHPDILRYYNSVIRGVQNYYAFSRNRTDVARIGWLIKESCALTLARKFKLKTLKKAFETFGKDLSFKTTKNDTLSLSKVAYTRASRIAEAVSPTRDPLKNIEAV